MVVQIPDKEVCKYVGFRTCLKLSDSDNIRIRIQNSDTSLTTPPINGLFSRTTWVSRYQKGKDSLDLNEARDDRVQCTKMAENNKHKMFSTKLFCKH